jgi:hypothetical protein
MTSCLLSSVADVGWIEVKSPRQVIMHDTKTFEVLLFSDLHWHFMAAHLIPVWLPLLLK